MRRVHPFENNVGEESCGKEWSSSLRSELEVLFSINFCFIFNIFHQNPIFLFNTDSHDSLLLCSSV